MTCIFLEQHGKYCIMTLKKEVYFLNRWRWRISLIFFCCCNSLESEYPKNNWPQAEKKLNMKEKIKVAIQINGKTRKIIDVYRDLSENDVVSACLKDKKLDKQLNKKRIFKTIFVQNKIINFLIK